MPGPKQSQIGMSRGQRAPKGIFKSTYDTLTSAENASVVRSIALFGVSVALISSSWAEALVGYGLALFLRIYFQSN
ncbi:hypothetical protein B0H66DRAFT_605210 [Apodospora peruviana]|uniref:Uncharacterized protein n=1 Tax=Apodospora peruviana TaxID=516989 RepID=A0AAE0I1R5_9PEZI|nr:hypothetical protein B0H66DRAFT_605210 [Apodospora peruviana]